MSEAQDPIVTIRLDAQGRPMHGDGQLRQSVGSTQSQEPAAVMNQTSWTPFEKAKKMTAGPSKTRTSRQKPHAAQLDPAADLALVTQGWAAPRKGPPPKAVSRESVKARATRERLAAEEAEATRRRKEDEKKRRERVKMMRTGDFSNSDAHAGPEQLPSARTQTWRRGQWDSEGWRVDTTIDREALGISNDAAVAQASRDLKGSYEFHEAQFASNFKAVALEGPPAPMHPRSVLAKTTTLQGAVVDPSFADPERGKWLKENPPRTDPNWNTDTRLETEPAWTNSVGPNPRDVMRRSNETRLLWDAERKEREGAERAKATRPRSATPKPKPGDKVQVTRVPKSVDGVRVGDYGIVQSRKTWPEKEVAVLISKSRSDELAPVVSFPSQHLTVVESPARVWKSASVVSTPEQDARSKAAESLRKRKEYGRKKKLVKSKGATVDKSLFAPGSYVSPLKKKLADNDAAWGGKSLERSLSSTVSPPLCDDKRHWQGRMAGDAEDDDDDVRRSGPMDAETHFGNTAGRPMNPSQKRTDTIFGAKFDPWQPGVRGSKNPHPPRCDLTWQPHRAPPHSQSKPLKKPYWHDKPERAAPRRVKTTPPWGDDNTPDDPLFL